MSAESTGPRARLRPGWVAFRHWRWQRPFWAGLFTILAGFPIGYLPYHNVTFGQLSLRLATTAGAGSLIIGVLLVVLGLTMWFQSAVRVFAGVASILLGLVSIPVSNFGGIVIGFLLALFGGALSIAWAPGVPAADDPGEKAEFPGGATDPEGARGDVPDHHGPVVPAQGHDPYAPAEPVPAGMRPEEESEENGRHRAG
ncbi:hypothetical protein GA0115240_10295 [Streptomyces sp. DvalAA-14]|uniref:DUF6114 domain-containing protein n=1 Tax=unclassified Streptomyces TaxID=2593676 RepID=UPI00081B6EB0|nr:MULTISPECIES: DUF6114 domain-containing protein [unclassified Streptomyces]MYS19001.1 hypothetical protein [Streptomyces sp. SID4948]SCD33787.1 hypothetical protein GA0115240_10295 [Streptomyces sp. DvalAA-14]